MKCTIDKAIVALLKDTEMVISVC